MANQPTKYRKFIVGAASAALVASAVAPVASAAEFKDTKGNTHEPAIDALSDAGIITGYPDGTFQPNKTLTRSDVVKLMGKWLVSEGYAVPTDYKTNPRFADLKSTSNDELLQYAAVVKDNGVFVGTPDGKLDPAGNITRENMAIVLVRAFDRVHDIDLATYVAGQEFKKDVTDLGSAKSEARPAIDVLDFFDITNPAAPQFNPKSTTTRGHFATFLHKTLNADFSDVGSGVVGTANVKAVNATTVEVTFKDAVENINSLNFTIDGLTVSNAAVKQTDNKVVVLTTAVQKGGEKYTVSLNNQEIGSFEGISAVIPADIKLTTKSVQGVVGQQVILTADIGTKEQNVPVTFNIDGDNNALNQDIVQEVYTNAEGIATFSYTQYNADSADHVFVYPTGAPAKRDQGYVYWGISQSLTVVADDDKGNSLNNGEGKVYKATYLDPKDGKPVSNATLKVTFAENVNVPIDKITKATVNGKTPYQLSNRDEVEVVEIKTNSKGEVTFTVSGTNTKATPIVFVDKANRDGKFNDKLDADERQVTADQLVFGANQLDHKIEITRDGGEEAAKGDDNGRKYKVVVKTKDGKAASGEIINVALNEDIDRIISTNTDALIRDHKDADEYAGEFLSDSGKNQVSIKLNSKGEAEFRITSDSKDAYATPIVWLDINSADAKQGVLDEGEPYLIAEKTYFADEKLTAGRVRAYSDAGLTTRVKNDKHFTGAQTAYFAYDYTNQSGQKMTSAGVTLNASFTVFNTGSNEVEVSKDGVNWQTVSPNRSYTLSVDGQSTPVIQVKSIDGKSSNVRVEATATSKHATDSKKDGIYLGKYSETAKFLSTTEVPARYTGTVASINKADEKITFQGKEAISYKNATSFVWAGAEIGKSKFEELVEANLGNAIVTADKPADSDNYTKFTINSLENTNPVNPVQQAKAALNTSVTAAKAALDAATVGEQPGQHPQAAYDAYDTAIKAAAAEAAKADATVASLNAAKTALDAATTAFNDAKVKEETPADAIVFTTVTAEAANILAQTFAGAVEYNIAGTVADADVTELTLTFEGKEDAPETVTVEVVDGKFVWTIAEDEFFGDFNKVTAKYTIGGVEKTESADIKVEIR